MKKYVDFCACGMCHYGLFSPLVQKETVVFVKFYSLKRATMALAHNQLNINCVECSITLQYLGSDVLLFNDIRQFVLHHFLFI